MAAVASKNFTVEQALDDDLLTGRFGSLDGGALEEAALDLIDDLITLVGALDMVNRGLGDETTQQRDEIEHLRGQLEDTGRALKRSAQRNANAARALDQARSDLNRAKVELEHERASHGATIQRANQTADTLATVRRERDALQAQLQRANARR